MRIVLDTNVFVSGVFWKGPPSAILEAWIGNRVDIVLSPAILEEYQRVGQGIGRRLPEVDLGPIVEALVANAEIVPDIVLNEQVCSDPDDDMFIAAAISGGAHCVITGDKALQNVREYRGIRIMSPAAFLRSYLAKHKDMHEDDA